MYTSKIALIVSGVLLGWALLGTQPPSPKICGSPGGPPVTALRIELSDGRHLAYVERGVAKEVAKYKIITIHGMSSSKDMVLPASQELIEELGIYFLAYDRAGYGESDPNPERSIKSDTFDIQELADQLNIGEKFYVLGISMGGCAVWGCLKYIPDRHHTDYKLFHWFPVTFECKKSNDSGSHTCRLAGAALVVPVINYWWPSLPSVLTKQVYGRQSSWNKWGLSLAHHLPQLYSCITRRFSSASSSAAMNPTVFSAKDIEVLAKMLATGSLTKGNAVQQGEFESIHRDILVGFGEWGFDPLDLNNPFEHNEGSVHIWQGYEDKLIPVLLQRYVSERLPWIKYHEISYAGHLLPFTDNLFDAIIKALLVGENPNVM